MPPFNPLRTLIRGQVLKTPCAGVPAPRTIRHEFMPSTQQQNGRQMTAIERLHIPHFNEAQPKSDLLFQHHRLETTLDKTKHTIEANSKSADAKLTRTFRKRYSQKPGLLSRIPWPAFQHHTRKIPTTTEKPTSVDEDAGTLQWKIGIMLSMAVLCYVHMVCVLVEATRANRREKKKREKDEGSEPEPDIEEVWGE